MYGSVDNRKCLGTMAAPSFSTAPGREAQGGPALAHLLPRSLGRKWCFVGSCDLQPARASAPQTLLSPPGVSPLPPSPCPVTPHRLLLPDFANSPPSLCDVSGCHHDTGMARAGGGHSYGVRQTQYLLPKAILSLVLASRTLTFPTGKQTLS